MQNSIRLFIFILLGTFDLYSQSFTSNNIEYIITDTLARTATITNYTGTDTNLILKDTIDYQKNSYTVTNIGNSAFAAKGLTSVTLPAKLEYIEPKAFYQNNDLSEVTCAHTVPFVLHDVFEHRENIVLNIPTGLTSDYYAYRWGGFKSINEAGGKSYPKQNKLITTTHEIGASIGLSNFNSDFAPKYILHEFITINGATLSAAHYLGIKLRGYENNPILKNLILKTNFSLNYSFFNNYSYGTKNAKIENPPLYTIDNTPNKVLLGKLTSKTLLLSMDNELQFYLKDVIKCMAKSNKEINLNPYVALGFGVHYVKSSPVYNPGKRAFNNNAGGNNGYPDNYKSNFIAKTNAIVLSANCAMGTRYKISSNMNLIAQLGIKYYLSDWMDGVNPNLTSNKSNDFNSIASIGLVYKLFQKKPSKD